MKQGAVPPAARGPAAPARLRVLLTPRSPGGHEVALFGWLGDAASAGLLDPEVVAPQPALREACAAAGLPAVPVAPAHGRAHRRSDGDTDADATRRQILRSLQCWPRNRPLLLAPGVLHADAWLLAGAVLLGHRPWLYVPMTYSARRMGYSVAWWRDRLLAPWLQRVSGCITPDEQQSRQLRSAWRLRVPVHVLPNIARVQGHGPCWPPPDPQGRLRVACVGRYELHQKGLDWLADALRNDAALSDRCRWRFQGRGPGEGALQELASALGPHRATVHGHAPLDEALAGSDVLLLPSRFEGVPLVALEATARGWPVVATRGNGLDHLLPAASLFRFGDAPGMARALDGLRDATARRAAVRHALMRLDVAHGRQPYDSALRAVAAALLGINAPAAT